MFYHLTKTCFFFAFLIISACTHTADLKTYNAKPATYPSLKDKRIAIVIDEKVWPDERDGKIPLSTYQVTGLTKGIADAVKTRVSTGTKVVNIVTSLKEIESALYDEVLYPTIQIHITNTSFGHRCGLNFGLSRQDVKSENYIGLSGLKGYSTSFILNEACNDALEQVFEKVVNQTVNFTADIQQTTADGKKIPLKGPRLGKNAGTKPKEGLAPGSQLTMAFNKPKPEQLKNAPGVNQYAELKSTTAKTEIVEAIEKLKSSPNCQPQFAWPELENLPRFSKQLTKMTTMKGRFDETKFWYVIHTKESLQTATWNVLCSAPI